MAGAMDRSTSRGQLVALSFGQANSAASQTDVQLVAADPSGNDHYPAGCDGYVYGIAWSLSAAITAGTATIGVTFDGTEDANSTISLPADSTTTSGVSYFAKNKIPFTKLKKIGVEISTNSGFLPITTDLTVQVLVILDLPRS